MKHLVASLFVLCALLAMASSLAVRDCVYFGTEVPMCVNGVYEGGRCADFLALLDRGLSIDCQLQDKAYCREDFKLSVSGSSTQINFISTTSWDGSDKKCNSGCFSRDLVCGFRNTGAFNVTGTALSLVIPIGTYYQTICTAAEKTDYDFIAGLIGSICKMVTPPGDPCAGN